MTDALLTNVATAPADPALPAAAGAVAVGLSVARPARKPQLPALTGLRTLLAVNIMLFHFMPPHTGALFPLINNSFVFVGFFILLSGYILAYNYADRPGPLDKREFWRARFARLYPIYLLSLLLFAGMLVAEWHARSHVEWVEGVLLTPLLLQGWSPMLATFWNTVAWTLSAEAFLYFLFPWLLQVRWPRSPWRLVAVFLAIWAVGLVPHTLYLLTNPDHLVGPANRYSSGYWIRSLKYTPLAYVTTFVAGMVLGRLQAQLTLSARQRTAVAGVSLVALVAFFAAGVDRVPYILLHGGFLVPLFAALTIGLSGRNLFASALAWKPIELLGQASYALFLLHFNFINLLHRHHVAERLHVQALDPWISYAAAIALAYAAMYFVERPAREALLRRSAVKAG